MRSISSIHVRSGSLILRSYNELFRRLEYYSLILDQFMHIDFPFTIIYTKVEHLHIVELHFLSPRTIEFVRTSSEFGHPLFIHNYNFDIKKYEKQVSLS